MLRIRIDGQDVEATPTLLAKLVLDGKVDRHSAVRLPGGTAEQPLEQSLGSPHGEALTAELHRRLQMMCEPAAPLRVGGDATAVDVQELCARVEGLCQWRWENSAVAARFFWAAAWLNELADRAKEAVEFYDTFLLLPFGESHLRLLALNNRGVLRLQLGRLEGVQDLARAAIPDCGLGGTDQGSRTIRLIPDSRPLPLDANPQSAIRNPQLDGLPAACFNLLNLINVSFGVAGLVQTVDEELADFFFRLPEDLRTFWLGQFSELDNPDAREEPSDPSTRSPEAPSAQRAAARPAFGSGAGPAPAGRCQDLLILRDPTYRRLNTLVTRLSVQARGLAPDRHRPPGPAPGVFRQVSLWDCRLDGGPPGPEVAAAGGNRSGPGRHERYAEAASLLLSDDIPSVLTRRQSPLARMEQSAREELAVTEGLLASGRYELAKSRLQVQRQVLVSLNAHGGLAAVLARVEAQLEKAAALETQEVQLRFQQASARLISEVQEFCTLTDMGQAQSRLPDLQRRLQQFWTQPPSAAAAEASGLLDELETRLQRHMDGLRRVQTERLIEEPRQQVRQNRPCEPTVPVPASVYQALAQCRLHDPQNWIEDWAALEEQLNAHQAQYHARRALSLLQSNPGAWDQVWDDLAEALKYDPSSWPALSALFGWTADEGPGKGAHGADPPTANCGSPFTIDQAGLLLERVLRQEADARRCLRLWRQVEITLSPALAGGDAETLTRARLLAGRCLDSWPAGSAEVPGRADPRHPVNRFLEACEKARCLAEAEQLLEARPPRLEEAQQHLAGILQSGVETRDQLRRIVTGFYLARCREKDSPSVQRQVLADLEAWAEAVPSEAVPQMRGREIVEETEKVRVGVMAKCEV